MLHKYRPEIDGLRAIAIFMVVMYHADFSFFQSGYIGVDIFFVISGYLITGVILNSLEKNSFSVKDFYISRLRRILPGLYIVIASTLILRSALILEHDIKSYYKSLISAVIFSSNIFFYITTNYFDNLSQIKPLIHTWSLSVEEQYYLVYPFFLIFLYKYSRNNLMKGLMVFMGLSLFLAIYISKIDSQAAFYLILGRSYEFLIGGIAYLIARKITFNNLYKNIASLLAFTLLLVSILFINNNHSYEWIRILMPCLFVGALLIFSDAQTYVGNLLSFSFFTNIGKISYSIYLWHQPIFSYIKRVYSDNLYEMNLQISIVAITVTLLLSYFTWKYIEKPFRYKFENGKFLIITIILSIVLCTVGVIGLYTDKSSLDRGYVTAYEGDIGLPTEFYNYLRNNYFECENKVVKLDAPQWNHIIRCMQSQKNKKVDYVIIGDSHAEHLFIGMAEFFNKKNVAFYIRNSAPFIYNSDFDKIYNSILNDNSIKKIFISMAYLDKIKISHKNKVDFELEFIKTINVIKSARKELYIIGDLPTFPHHPERCKFYYTGYGGPICSVKRPYVENNATEYKSIIKSILDQNPYVKYIDLYNYICDSYECSMIKNGRLIYRDDNHLNIIGSKDVGKFIGNTISIKE